MVGVSERGGPRRAPVMIDVARLAGVSHQTVSRVLNNSENVSPQVRERVEVAVSQLGYRRNTAARALVTRRTMNLGVVAVGTSQYGPSTTLFGIAEAARDAGYATGLVSLADIDRRSMRAALDHLVSDAVDGIVVIAPVTAAVAAVEGMVTDVPLVMFEPGADNGTTIVAIDEVLGARFATRHLLELGHDTVWHVAGPPGWLGSEARLRGWSAELTANGRVANEVVVGDWGSGSGYDAGSTIAARSDVTAVFVANDQMALGVLAALRNHGLRVPEDLSVVGFDDVPESRYFQPSLTTVRLDFAEVGHRCVERLLGLIHGNVLEPTPAVAPELLIRATTGPPPRRRRALLPHARDAAAP